MKNLKITILCIIMFLIFSSCSFATTGNIKMKVKNKKEFYAEGEELEIVINSTENIMNFNYIDLEFEHDKNDIEILEVESDLNDGNFIEKVYNPSTNMFMLYVEDPVDIDVNGEIAKIKLKIKNKNITNKEVNFIIKNLYYCDVDGNETTYEGENDRISINIKNEESSDLYLNSYIYKFGNTKENDLDVYSIEDTNISKISSKTSIEEFIGNLGTNADTIEIYDLEDNLITDYTDIYIGTGMKIKLSKDNSDDTILLDIAVTGDIDGNGKVEANDLADTILKSINLINLNEIQMIAIDMDSDGEITPADLADEIKLSLIS